MVRAWHFYPDHLTTRFRFRKAWPATSAEAFSAVKDHAQRSTTRSRTGKIGVIVELARIPIQNFRNFATLDISLAGNVVVVGENRVGWSNLLHALRLLLDPTLLDRGATRRPRPLRGEWRAEIGIVGGIS
jgi:hypothetical protein